MKKALFVLLAISLCLSALSGCSDRERSDFEFTYQIEKTKYARGEIVNITATLTNISGRTYRYTGSSGDFFPAIELYCNGKATTIAHDPIVLPTDVVNRKIKNGESGYVVYSFPIPKDAPCGDYHITLSYGGESKEFPDVFTLIEITSQNEMEKYQYSPILISSGESTIRPIQCFLGTTEYENGEPTLFGCGDGIYRLFGNPETDPSEFPILVLDSEITLTVPVNVTVGSIRIYDTDFNELEFKPKSFPELSELPIGEYLIVFFEKTDGRGCDPEITDYQITDNESLFRLVLLERAQ